MSGFFVCCECAAVGSPESFTVGVSHQALPTIERSQHRSRCRGGNPGWSNPPDTLRWIGGCKLIDSNVNLFLLKQPWA